MLLTILNDVSAISYNMDHLVELVGLCVVNRTNQFVNDHLHLTPCIHRTSNSLLMMTTNGVDDGVVFCIFSTQHGQARKSCHGHHNNNNNNNNNNNKKKKKKKKKNNNNNNNNNNNMILIVITNILYIRPLIVSHELIAPSVNFCPFLSFLHMYFRADTIPLTT